MNKLKILALAIILITIFSNIQIYSQLLLRDDFQTKNDYWFWRSDGNQSIPIVSDGMLNLHLNNGVSSEYCNTEIYDPDEPYGPGTQVRIRLKTSEIHHGSRGWGFWDGDLTILDVAYDFDVAWVMQQGSAIDDQYHKWFQFGVARDTLVNRQIFELENVVDETEWHTYKIIWDFDKVQFFIDDNFLYETFDYLPDEKMRVDIWIDNRVINTANPIVFWNNEVESSKMYVDFVEVSNLNGPQITRKLEESIVLWETPNSFPDGAINSIWNQYDFSTNSSGEALFFITGYAESYGELQDDDDLKIVINDEDYGWDSEKSLDGHLLNGRGKSIVINKEVNSGEHLLKLYSDITPFVRDVIVLYSEGGKTLYSQDFNEIIEQNDGLWNTIKFDNNGFNKVKIVISATANENEGLQFQLNENEFGWSENTAIIGDSLKGIPNTIILSDSLEPGEQNLHIFNKGNPEIHSIAVYGLSPLTDIKTETNIVESFKLATYPNPFNVSTQITYNTISASQNRIKIVDILGKEVEILVDEFQASGQYDVFWNAKDVTSGIYFCILESGNYFKVQKLILLK